MSLAGILLDLDDTLYPENDYFRSGLAAVAEWLHLNYGNAPGLQDLLDDVGKHGRKGVLDRIPVPLAAVGMDRSAWRHMLLQIYRLHEPEIHLSPDFANFLEDCRRRQCRTALITDGKSCVQWRKIRALGLQSLIDVIVVTDDIEAPKPSLLPFLIASQRLQCQVDECIYIADDASKDFFAPRQLGMRTLQVSRALQYPLARPAPSVDYEAEHCVASLADAASFIFGGHE
ncbi:HAD family hydrolase [Chitinilyticum piscinae]|uniref:HAD family hydrolase n=1 Tax=Chitinilyticum piscinae TaxID=2866724 RepID=A0A8J7FIJ2_9NEIS|nr:HAD family hydrolase [Chitinilyticum piscinae]MBE9608820.1 HAD family hydrolase [Chitinilyticum piscinae]